MIFARRLQQLLDELNINQSELGRRLNVKPQSVQGWLKGVIPRMDKLEKLAKLADRPVYWFFMPYGEEDNHKQIINVTDQPKLTGNKQKILELLDDLPTSDTEQIIRDMEQKRDFYRRKLEELLRERNKPA